MAEDTSQPALEAVREPKVSADAERIASAIENGARLIAAVLLSTNTGASVYLRDNITLVTKLAQRAEKENGNG